MCVCRYLFSKRLSCVQVYDLGRDGSGLSSVASMTMDHVAQTSAAALRCVSPPPQPLSCELSHTFPPSFLRTADRSLVRPIVQLSVIPSSESSTLHMLAITKAGVWLVCLSVCLYVCVSVYIQELCRSQCILPACLFVLTGVRLYFTTTPNGVVARPSLLALVHARLPPGFSPSSAAQRPGNSTHQAFYRKGKISI